MTAAAQNMATLNGLAGNAASASLVSSPSGDGNNAVKVTVSTTVPLHLAEIFESNTTIPVTATSYAEVKPNAVACVIALNASSSGIILLGGTSVSAPGCTVASDAAVSVPCGTSITTKTLDYNSAALPSEPCTGIKPPAGTSSVNIVKATTPDPLASNSAVAAAFSHLTSVAAMTSPAGPTVSAGTTISFGYRYQFDTVATDCDRLHRQFCVADLDGDVPARRHLSFRRHFAGGWYHAEFRDLGCSPSNTYDFSGAINNSGSAATFGPGTYNVAGGIYTGGGTTTTFGAGTYNIGAGTVSCSGSFYSLCNTGSALTFAGEQFHHCRRNLQQRRCDAQPGCRQFRQQFQHRVGQRRLCDES